MQLVTSETNHPQSLLTLLGEWGYEQYRKTKKTLRFMYGLLGALWRFLIGKSDARYVDFLWALQNCSYQAVGIVSLVSFMVGLILAFVGAIQLRTFGAEIYVSSLVAIGMTRIMGAIMVGIIMSGRTGASYAATIGSMQVNEEVDALRTMGVSTMDFLVVPRFIALVLAIPFLVILADALGIIGGLFVGVSMLDLGIDEYVQYTVKALTFKNFLVGIIHGIMFGGVIAICGCYCGMNCGRHADSVGTSTTTAVVSSVVWMIMLTGILTVICEVLKI